MEMYNVRRTNTDDARILGEIHSRSWKIAYRGIVPDSILDNISAEKRQKYFEKALSANLEEDYLIFTDETAVGLMCIGKCRDEDKDDTFGEIWEYTWCRNTGKRA